MIEESLEKLPATQPSRSCTIIRYNYEQIERDGVQLWQTNSVFLFSDTDIKKVPIGIVGEINLSNQSLSEAEIDAILRYFYSYRDQFRTPYPMINIGGSNASPSGDYREAIQPTTGKELAYSLVNQHGWTIIFTEG